MEVPCRSGNGQKLYAQLRIGEKAHRHSHSHPKPYFRHADDAPGRALALSDERPDGEGGEVTGAEPFGELAPGTVVVTAGSVFHLVGNAHLDALIADGLFAVHAPARWLLTEEYPACTVGDGGREAVATARPDQHRALTASRGVIAQHQLGRARAVVDP